MVVSSTAYYAVRIAIALAQQQGDWTKIKAIAERAGISRKSVEHIVGKLRTAGLVRSFK
ncbi:MAG: Rrf2 family transcriptional regulator, partial [Planctomycetota bacterium]